MTVNTFYSNSAIPTKKVYYKIIDSSFFKYKSSGKSIREQVSRNLRNILSDIEGFFCSWGFISNMYFDEYSKNKLFFLIG